jgi:hypothetical protein
VPIELTVYGERRRVEVKIRGDFTREDIIDAVDRAVTDPEFRPGFDILSDHTEIGEPLTPEQANVMIGHLMQKASLVKLSRLAFVAPRPASYGMMRMISVMVESVPMHAEVFVSREEAEAWLDAPHDATS